MSLPPSILEAGDLIVTQGISSLLWQSDLFHPNHYVLWLSGLSMSSVLGQGVQSHSDHYILSLSGWSISSVLWWDGQLFFGTVFRAPRFFRCKVSSFILTIMSIVQWLENIIFIVAVWSVSNQKICLSGFASSSAFNHEFFCSNTISMQ